MPLAALRPGLQLGPGTLRLLLAIVVVVSHLSALNIGRPAVVIFFVLSGYWVSLRWLGGADEPVKFALVRTLRVWPLFALVSLATWAGLGALGLPRSPDPAAGLLLLGSASRGDMVLMVAWSLDLELQYYLSVPLLWLAARRLPAAQLWLLGGAAWALGVWLMQRGAWNFLAFLPAFAAGMWLAQARWAAGPRQALAGIAGFVAIGAGLAAWPAARPLLLKAPGLPLVVEQMGHLAWSAALLPLAAHVLAGPSSPRDRALGDASYALYLVHSPVITLLAAALALGGMALKLAALPAIALATLALYLWVDRPLEAARRQRSAGLLVTPGFAPLNSERKRPN